MPSLDWIGKKAVVNHHKEVPFHLLHCDRNLSVGNPGSGNLLVQGDNLIALKAILPYYAGQVACIYIDPPYNTGEQTWIYNDRVDSPEIRAWLGKVVGKEAEDLSRHDKWLCMMYPRLYLLRKFLKEDGAIFVSIDDTEYRYLRCVMDEIFGTRNFIDTIVWQKKQSPQNDAINLSDMHDYIVVYAKRAKSSREDPKGWQRNLLPRGDKQDKRYKNPDDDPRGDWTSVDYTCNKTADERPNLYYPIVNPVTKKEIWPSRNTVWRYDRQTHKRNMQENRVWWGRKGTNIPRFKRFKSEVADGIVPSTWWTREEAGDNQEARRELRRIFSQDEQDFPTPKPTRLIKRILQLATNENALIMDSFAGSGTTGHAVLDLNKMDGGNRRFILVEMDKDICQNLTAQRLQRVIKGYVDKRSGEKKKMIEGLGGGFRYCRLGSPLFAENGDIRDEVKFADLAAHVYFSETGEPLPKRVTGKTPLLGTHNGTGIYLLYNGILRDREPEGGNVLTRAALSQLPKHEGPKIIYGAGCRLGQLRLRRKQITFKQIPYQVRVS